MAMTIPIEVVNALPSEMSPLEPVGTSLHLAGNRDEVLASADLALNQLVTHGWSVASKHTVPGSPQMWASLARGPETLTLTMTECSHHRVHEPQEVALLVNGLVLPDSIQLIQKYASHIPFTDTEIRRIEGNMPLTRTISANAHRWVPQLDASLHQPLRGYGAIFTIHHQTDFIVLLRRALELGLQPNLITVIDKEYHYLHSSRVDAYVKQRLDVPVFRYGDLTRALNSHIERVHDDRVESNRRTWLQSIIIDDGGYVLPVLARDYEPYLGLFRGIVEQTASGIWNIQPYLATIRMPVFSVAESDLKSTVEAQGVAMAGINNLRRLLPQEKLDGRRAIVVGFGRIGGAVAEHLRQLNVQVVIVENAAPQAVTARQRGYEVVNTCAEAVRRFNPRYIFACARPNAVGAEVFTEISGLCFLISFTSRDTAIDKRALEAGFEGRRYGNIGTVYASQDDAAHAHIFLVADGFPINFHFAESMPNQQSDLIMASLLVGAITLATTDPPWRPGNEPELANIILNQGGLLQDFLELDDGFGMDIQW